MGMKQRVPRRKGSRIRVIQTKPEEENASLAPQKSSSMKGVSQKRGFPSKARKCTCIPVFWPGANNSALNPLWSGKAAPGALSQLHRCSKVGDTEAKGATRRIKWVSWDVGNFHRAHSIPKHLFSLGIQQTSVCVCVCDQKNTYIFVCLHHKNEFSRMGRGFSICQRPCHTRMKTSIQNPRTHAKSQAWGPALVIPQLGR